MSHHLDSPTSRRDPRLNVTDVYAFDSDSAAGIRIANGSTGAPIPGSGVRAWCGAAADPFYLDLYHLAHILEGLQNEQPIDNGEWTVAQAASSFTGSQICAIVLEIPASDTALRPLFRALGGDDDSAEYQRDTSCGPATSSAAPWQPALAWRGAEHARHARHVRAGRRLRPGRRPARLGRQLSV